MVKNHKIIYQGGKGNKLVPVIITSDLIDALNILSDKAIRCSCGINPENKFLFPSKSGSLSHVSGYYANKQLSSSNISGLMTATKMRHRAATLHANMGKTSKEKQEFFEHMGHEGEVNI